MVAARYFNALGLNIMADKQRRIQKLVESIITYLRAHRGAAPGDALTLKKLAAIDLSDKNFIDAPPQGTRHDEVLNDAVARIAPPNYKKLQIV